MDLIEKGLAEGLITFSDDRTHITYVHQDKKRKRPPKSRRNDLRRRFHSRLNKINPLYYALAGFAQADFSKEKLFIYYKSK